MGRRYRRLKCRDCNHLYWQTFEHFNLPDALINFAKTITCPECDSGNWEITAETEFSGLGLGRKPFHGIVCEKCREDTRVDVSRTTPEELIDLAMSLECQTCGADGDLELQDTAYMQGPKMYNKLYLG